VKFVVRVDGVEKTIACANDNVYGLCGPVCSAAPPRSLAVAQRIESGISHVNGPTLRDEAQMPFGGVKGSGWGRFGGPRRHPEFTVLW
jgi:acyl-CoA reductase-like NAD-dependent aldehyde dehydrogenase